MWMTHGLKSKKRERVDRGPTSFIRLTCTYSTPLWQCFLRNWKTFLTTFSTSWKGCWIWGWTKGVKWTTPTSTYSERKSRQRGVSTDLKTRLQRVCSWECGERKWQKKSSQVWSEGECQVCQKKNKLSWQMAREIQSWTKRAKEGKGSTLRDKRRREGRK